MNFGNANPYSAPRTGLEAAAAYAAENERVGFIRRTYLHVGAAMFAFAAIEALLLTTVNLDPLMRAMAGNRFIWLGKLVGFMVVGWIARSWAESDTSVGLQYAGLSLYVVIEAIIFLPLLYFANAVCGGGVIQSLLC